jgi:hypothetical protein
MRSFLLACLIFFALAPEAARARHVHGISSAFNSCPMGIANTDILGTPDGCLLAQASGSAFTPRATVLSPTSLFALQSGQSAYVGAIPYNMAGSDFPTGRTLAATKLDPAAAAIFSGAYISGTLLYYGSVSGTPAAGQYIDVVGGVWGTTLVGPCTSSPCTVSNSQTVGSSGSPLTISATVAKLPLDCHYYPVGASTYTASPYGVPMWLCQITAANHASVWGTATILGDATNSGFDHSGNSSTSDPCAQNAASVTVCPSNGVWVAWKNSAFSSTCSIKIVNDNFDRTGSNFNATGGQTFLRALYFFSAAGDAGCNRTIKYNDFTDGFPNAYDLANPTNQRDTDPIVDVWANNADIEFNSFYALTARSYDGNPPINGFNLIFRYNYLGPIVSAGYGICGTCGGNNYHGEEWQVTPANGIALGTINSDFNTLIVPSFTLNSAWAAPFAMIGAQGFSNTLAAGSSVDNNTVILNYCNSLVRTNATCTGVNAKAISAEALLYLRYSQFLGFTFSGNRADANGTYRCAYAEGSVLAIGNLNGTNINITSTTAVGGAAAAQPSIFPAGASGGAWLYSNDNSISTPTQILSQSSGTTGNPGSYVGSVNEGGATINFPNTTNAEITPSFSYLNWPTYGPGANINLIDGSVITPGAGFQMSNGQCTDPNPG